MQKTYVTLKGRVRKTGDKLEIVATDETLDRQGEVIPADSWDFSNYLKSPRLLVDHDYSVKSIVGVAKNLRREGSQTVFEPVFHDITQLARETGEMVKQAFLDTVSVGFQRQQKGDETVNELLEISFVAVPANPNARLLSYKKLDKINPAEEAKVSEFIKKTVKAQHEEGEPCVMEDGTEGEMHANEEGQMVCIPKSIKQAEGDPCTMSDGSEGELHPDEGGNMVCMPKKTKAEKQGPNIQSIIDSNLQDMERKIQGTIRETGRAITSDVENEIGDFIDLGITGEGKQETTKIQTLVLSKETFPTQEEATKWVADHEFRHDKVDETEGSWRYRQFEPTDCLPDTFRSIDIAEGVTGVICRPQEGKTCGVPGLKVGRVISAKTRRQIEDSIKTMESSIGVLKALLEEAPPKDAGAIEGVKDKGEQPGRNPEATIRITSQTLDELKATLRKSTKTEQEVLRLLNEKFSKK